MKKTTTLLIAAFLFSNTSFSKEKKSIDPQLKVKLEVLFNEYQQDTHELKIGQANTVYEIKQSNLKELYSKKLEQLNEIKSLKETMKFGEKEANKQIKLKIKEKQKLFSKEQIKLEREALVSKLKEVKNTFKEKMKARRKELKAKMKEVRESSKK